MLVKFDPFFVYLALETMNPVRMKVSLTAFTRQIIRLDMLLWIAAFSHDLMMDVKTHISALHLLLSTNIEEFCSLQLQQTHQVI